MTNAAADWYPSEREGFLRYWDGHTWTDHYHPDPNAAPPPAVVAAFETGPAVTPPTVAAPASSRYDDEPGFAVSAAFQPVIAVGARRPGARIGTGAAIGIAVGAIVLLAALLGGVGIAAGWFGSSVAVAGVDDSAAGTDACPQPSELDQQIVASQFASLGIDAASEIRTATADDVVPYALRTDVRTACSYSTSGTMATTGATATTDVLLVVADDAVSTASVAAALESEGWSSAPEMASGLPDSAGAWMLSDQAARSVQAAIGMPFEAFDELGADRPGSALARVFPGKSYYLTFVTLRGMPDTVGAPEPSATSETIDPGCSSADTTELLIDLTTRFSSGAYNSHPMSLGAALVEVGDGCALELTARLDPGSTFDATDLTGILVLAADSTSGIPRNVSKLYVRLVDEHGQPASLARAFSDAGGDPTGITAESGVQFPMDAVRTMTEGSGA